MGVYSDFLAHTNVVDVTGEKVANQRSAYGELAAHAAKFDPAAPAFLGEIDEIQVLNAFTATVSGGNYTITIVDELGVSHTTANILFSATDSTIEAAIDTKMTADGYAGWSNSDIGVQMTGNLTANAATLTYDGNSVDAKNMGQATVNDVDLSGGGTVNGQSTTTHGQDKRYAWAVMWAHGMITSVPLQGDALATGKQLEETPATTTAHWPRAALRKLLALQASIDDDNIVLKGQLEALFNVE